MSVKFKAGDLVQTLSKEEIKQEGYLLSELGAKCANQIGVIQPHLYASTTLYWGIAFLNKDILEVGLWPEALIKKVVSSKNNKFEI